MNVTIIILNWNNATETLACLASVKASDYRQLKIMVVDNGSTDGSEERLQQKYPHVELIQTGSNLGYAGGNNAGIRRAMELGANAVLVLNNDCRVDKSCISKMVVAMESDPGVGMVSPKVYAEDMIISHAGSDFDWNNAYVTSSRGAGQQDDGQFDQSCDIETATGDCLLVSRGLINQVGLLDEGYFLYYEDTDWCLRARRAGYKIVYQPTAKAWHPGSLSTGGINKPIGAYYVLRNKLYFVNKYGPVLTKLKNLIHFVLSLAKNLVGLLGPNRKVARARLLAIFDFVGGRRGPNPIISNV